MRIVREKKIVVTGGAAGICMEAAIMFSEAGAEVYVLDLSDDRLDELKKEHPKITCIKADITDEKHIDEIFSQLGDIDVLINGASLQIEREFDDISIDESRRIWDVTYNGTLICTKSALKYMSEGTILDILTHEGIRTNQYPYAAAKSGVRTDIKNLAIYLSKKSQNPITINGITFAAVSGTIRNNDWMEDEKAVLEAKKRTPLHKIMTARQAGELIYAYIVYFSEFSTGSVFYADCGRSLV